MKVIPGSTEYAAFHEILRTSLFDQAIAEYSADEVDQYFRQPATRTALLLLFNGYAVGVATLDDFGNGQAAIRGVAVKENCQGRGHGRELGKMAAAFARSIGVTQLCVNADSEKTGYYVALGFKERIWGEVELEDCRAGRAWPMPVQMVKNL